jgi:hypothetical protein
MSEFKTWLEAIEADFPDDLWTREALVNEAQRTHFIGSLPPGFEFLRGAFIDLGFENLGLPPEELARVRLAFVGGGLAVLGTSYRLRNQRPAHSLVEPANGTEKATLPAHWRQGVLVIANDHRYSWVGKRLALELLSSLDLRDYADAGDGWRLQDDQAARPPSPPA